MELQERNDQQAADKNESITLPTLQRGFVWRPYQMEALWDSILRGYPIGSLLMSKAVDGTKFLLDGQQRCTTIALGFQNPLSSPKSNLLNIEKDSIPSIWIDLKPLQKDKYGLKYSVRVLTRSHPWGYSQRDHQKRLSMIDQRNALVYFRDKTGNDELGFSEVKPLDRSPWDAHFPVPLSFVLNLDKSELKEKVKVALQGIKTKHGVCEYADVKETWLDQLYEGISYAKKLLLPEILVSKESLEEETSSESETQEQNATLFLRLNSSGTRISGQELIYSLLKASFPEAKKLVEEIGLKYLAPSTVVNLFIRFLKMKRNGFENFERSISLEEFRRLLRDEEFKSELENLIKLKEGKALMDRSIGIIKKHPSKLPAILQKELISQNTDLLLLLLVYLHQNKEVNQEDEKGVRRSFLHSTLFSNSKEKTKLAQELIQLFKKEDCWKNWSLNWDKLCLNHQDLLPPLLEPHEFSRVLGFVREKLLEDRKNWLFSEEWLMGILRGEEQIVSVLLPSHTRKSNVDSEDKVNEEKQLREAVNYWKRLGKYLFWHRQPLIISQRQYFNREFDEYMAFDGIEDTNKPWDWDHIYPRSWIYRKQGISFPVRSLINSNGNYRALSFNENRSQSNNQSPSRRFENNKKAQVDSFILENDLPFWLDLTNHDTRLKNNHPKIEVFVKAVLTRIDNIYRECYSVMYELK
jgi:hypothetical protein